MPTPQELYDRFASLPEEPSGCREWTGRRNSGGYGVVSKSPVGTLAHRMAWYIHHGPIPDGMCVLHDCDNPSCVEVAHLHLGTRADNNRERADRGRSNTPKADPRWCKRGHDKTVTGIYMKKRPDGTKHPLCAQCYRESNARSAARRRS